MKTSDFDYYLPQELIAQTPIEPRDRARLMVLSRSDGGVTHHRFFELAELLSPGDVLVFNDSRVIPARLRGRKVDSGGRLEILLLRRLSPGVWETLTRPAKRASIGSRIEITGDTGDSQDSGVMAEVTGLGEGGMRVISFSTETRLPDLGKVPLPPYIRAPLANPERYQTVYASVAGSIAAPTAGLHFTPGLIDRIKAKEIRCLFVTLHVGLDSFRPVREDDPLQHPVYREYGVVSEGVARELSQARLEGRRVICVGTTTVRLLEAVAQQSQSTGIEPLEGWVSLLILPGHQFKMVNALITNFHLPRSTLLMLVTALAGREPVSKAYREAISARYRFYSFGDAMLII